MELASHKKLQVYVASDDRHHPIMAVGDIIAALPKMSCECTFDWTDQKMSQNEFVDKMTEGVRKADVVLIVVPSSSSHHRECFFVLGMAHALNKPTIVLHYASSNDEITWLAPSASCYHTKAEALTRLATYVDAKKLRWRQYQDDLPRKEEPAVNLAEPGGPAAASASADAVVPAAAPAPAPAPVDASLAVKAVKYNDGKLRTDLVEARFIEGIAAVLTYGSFKYSANNWKTGGGLTLEQIWGSLSRHYFSLAKGNKYDAETGIPEIYHLACNLMFLAWRMEEDDDIPNNYEKYYDPKRVRIAITKRKRVSDVTTDELLQSS